MCQLGIAPGEVQSLCGLGCVRLERLSVSLSAQRCSPRVVCRVVNMDPLGRELFANIEVLVCVSDLKTLRIMREEMGVNRPSLRSHR